jgi:hypothetical protein
MGKEKRRDQTRPDHTTQHNTTKHNKAQQTRKVRVRVGGRGRARGWGLLEYTNISVRPTLETTSQSHLHFLPMP